MREQVDLSGFTSLAVSVKHTQRTIDLPAIHSDPLDRLLAVQW